MSGNNRFRQPLGSPEPSADGTTPMRQRLVPSAPPPLRLPGTRTIQAAPIPPQATKPRKAVPALNRTPPQTPTHNNHRRENTPSPTPPAEPAPAPPDVPILYQESPRKESRYHNDTYVNRSPTESLESRGHWARKESLILEMQHQTHPPTHEAVAKFRQPVQPKTMKDFQRRMRQNLAYWSKVNAMDFSVYFVREIERTNCVHYHFLIRTDEPNALKVLTRTVRKASQDLARLSHYDAVNSPDAVTRYTTKDLKGVSTGEKPLLLFKRMLHMNLSGHWNGYFVRTKKALWDEWKRQKYGESAK